MGSHGWDGKPSLCRCCMTVKFSGCPRQMFLSREPLNKVIRRRNMDCLSFVKLSEPFFYCVAEIMFLSQAKLSEFKNIVSLSEQQAINIFATTKNLKMHQHLVLISRQKTSCGSFFLEKKTFCNSENNQPMDTFPLK